jgi:hypothetical protein
MSHNFFSDSNEILGAGSRETTDPPRIQRHFRPATLNLVRPSSARCVDSGAPNSHREMPLDISQIHGDLLRDRQEASRIQCGGVAAAHRWCWCFSSSQMKRCNTRACSKQTATGRRFRFANATSIPANAGWSGPGTIYPQCRSITRTAVSAVDRLLHRWPWPLPLSLWTLDGHHGCRLMQRTNECQTRARRARE